MKETSTLSNLLNQLLQNKNKKTEYSLEGNIKLKEESVQVILDYSKSVRFIKTRSIGYVLIINN